ncbi:valine--tRNA ligase, partial [Linderina pennispora]
MALDNEQTSTPPAPATPNSGNEASKAKNEAKNEAKRKAKMEKFLAKQAALAAKKDAAKDKVAAPKKEKEPKVAKAKPAFVNTTPTGEKKDMSQAMADSYEPEAVEAAWYSWWEKEGFFTPEELDKPNPKGRFVMATPPPNVTGKLHIGHALFISIQDSLVRWNRMRGVTTLFIPGADHAGIATQAVVEKQLWKNSQLTKYDLGRDKFVDKVWDWKNEYGGKIMNQIRRLGSSYDWTRER